MKSPQFWPPSTSPVEAHATYADHVGTERVCLPKDITQLPYGTAARCSNCRYDVRSSEELAALITAHQAALLDGQGSPVGPYHCMMDNREPAIYIYDPRRPLVKTVIAHVVGEDRISAVPLFDQDAVTRLFCGAPGLYEALRLLEWAGYSEHSSQVCLTCSAMKGNGHKKDCPVGRALAAVSEPTTPRVGEERDREHRLQLRMSALIPRWGPKVTTTDVLARRRCHRCFVEVGPQDVSDPDTPPVVCKACTEKVVR